MVCTTCCYDRSRKTDVNGQTGGKLLADILRQQVADRTVSIPIRNQSCLWACKRHCSVLLRDDQRYSYLAGDFQPTREHGRTILDWFEIHGLTQDGTVPFNKWPDAIKGHFIARIPPMLPLLPDQNRPASNR
ncbi:MAG: DUF1636 domain-containing protein [Alphaproteobacteria bacterium]|nr:DUF1636 domain-containing protein [Alphaproteobacteria bacterium]